MPAFHVGTHRRLRANDVIAYKQHRETRLNSLHAITDADNTAISIYNACASGMGGMDWAGVELLAALYQVEDVEGLLERLVVIKAHTPKDRTI